MSEAREGWSTGEHGDVELLDDAEAVDTADTIEETWAPGEPPVELPADHDLDLEQALPRTVLGGDGVETRFEELDSTEE